MKLKHRKHIYFYYEHRTYKNRSFCRKFKHSCSIIVYIEHGIYYVVFILSRTINYLCFICLQETDHRCRKWLMHQPAVTVTSCAWCWTWASGHWPQDSLYQSKDSPHFHLYYVEDNILLGERPNILLHTWLYSSYGH